MRNSSLSCQGVIKAQVQGANILEPGGPPLGIVVLVQETGANPFREVVMGQHEPSSLDVCLIDRFHGSTLVVAQQAQCQDNAGGRAFRETGENTITQGPLDAALAEIVQ